ncbi:Fungal specific transcription factor [Xylographa trunciseda]|nr:Fungal specific transcription factor [Xylographa trunciseda]
MLPRSYPHIDLSRRLSYSSSIRTDPVIDDYADLKGPSLLKKTLGLQNRRHSRYIGSTSEYEASLLDLYLCDDKGEVSMGHGSLRKVTESESFQMLPDDATQRHEEEVSDLDSIEQIVTPHGRALINLYFRIVHPSFPILHKKVYLEKYSRSHREFSPPLLAAVYIMALNWWSYSSDLAQLPKPNVSELETLALRTMSDVTHRPKLSTVQAGLLLFQRPKDEYSWAETAQLVAIGQDLGLHLDCSRWKIPRWERGLRKRLAWALFMQDSWASLVYGRPPHISFPNWAVKPVVDDDFPESAADEDEEDGSAEVEKGRTLFIQMIELSKMTKEVIESLYSQQAEAEIRSAGPEGIKIVLGRAKPIQLRLKSWYAALPECLQMDNIKPRKLSSTGYLHLAYYITEITLHRRIIRTLSSDTDSFLQKICRSAAKVRLVSAIEFFNHLKPEHLQSFWYFASKVNFALIGTYNGLLWVTSQSKEESDFYRRQLQEYRWALRVSNNGAGFLDIASHILDRSIGVLMKAASTNDAETQDLISGDS